jgi:hypothetical protein
LSSLLLSRNVKVKTYKTIILPVVLYVCENRVLRRIFGPKRDGVRGEWRKFNNEELHILCSSPDIIKCKAVPLHAMEALGGEEV